MDKSSRVMVAALIAAVLLFSMVMFFCPMGVWGKAAGMGDAVEGEVIKAPVPTPTPAGFTITGRFDFEQYRSGEMIDSWTAHNTCTTEGLGAILGCMFGSWSQAGTWYVFLFNDDYTPSIADTYAASGWSEHTEYDEATRPEWQGAATGTTQWSNTSNTATFTISDGVSGVSTIYGAGLVSGVTKDDTTAGLTLYNIAPFTASKNVEEDDVLKVTITLTANPE